MGVRAIDQTIFRLVLGKTKMFYCPRLTAEGNITLVFPSTSCKYFDLLPALPLNNCIIYTLL
jgi:hypothetical protein